MISCNEIGEKCILVEALDTYKNNAISDNVLGYVPEPGHQFMVTKERLNVLLGNNNHKLVFVKVIEEHNEEVKAEKKTIKKKKTK